MLKYLVAFVVAMHGIAHLAGPIGFFSSGEQAFADRPWIFSQGVTARTPLGKAWGLLWLVAMIGLVGTGLGILFGQAWWSTLGVVAAIISLVAIVPWVRVVPPGAWAGALFDLVILVALLSPLSDRVVDLLS